MADIMFNMDELTEMLNISRSTLHGWIQRGLVSVSGGPQWYSHKIPIYTLRDIIIIAIYNDMRRCGIQQTTAQKILSTIRRLDLPSILERRFITYRQNETTITVGVSDILAMIEGRYLKSSAYKRFGEKPLSEVMKLMEESDVEAVEPDESVEPEDSGAVCCECAHE